MVKAIASAVAGIIALITFVLHADRIVWDTQTWECLCLRTECGWCDADADLMTWDEWHAEEFASASAEFDALFAGVEFKVSKNGRSMVKGNYDRSFKFAKKG